MVRSRGSDHNSSYALERGAGVSSDTTEHVIVDGTVPADAFKTITLIRRRADVAREQTHDRWLEHHVPNVAEWVDSTPEFLRYVVSLTLGEEGEYDGRAETWWTSKEARTPAIPRLQRDGFGHVAAKAETLVGPEIVLA